MLVFIFQFHVERGLLSDRVRLIYSVQPIDDKSTARTSQVRAMGKRHNGDYKRTGRRLSESGVVT